MLAYITIIAPRAASPHVPLRGAKAHIQSPKLGPKTVHFLSKLRVDNGAQVPKLREDLYHITRV